MKNAIVILGMLITSVLISSAQENSKEQDFISRLEAFQKGGDMAQSGTIYEIGEVSDRGSTVLMGMDNLRLETLILRGVKTAKFHDIFIYPSARDWIKNGRSIEGGNYVPNLMPYKMLDVEYEKPLKNGFAGFSVLTGMKDGKIFISGWKKTQTNEPPATAAPMFTRVFLLPSAALSQMRLQVPPKTGETSQDYLLRYFKTQQVEFKAPAFLKFDEASGTLSLMVRTTKVDLDKIERIISNLAEKK